MFAIRENVLDIFFLMIADFAQNAFNQHIGKANDGVKWGAEFMGDGGEKAGFKLAGFFRPFTRGFDFQLHLLAGTDVMVNADNAYDFAVLIAQRRFCDQHPLWMLTFLFTHKFVTQKRLTGTDDNLLVLVKFLGLICWKEIKIPFP